MVGCKLEWKSVLYAWIMNLLFFIFLSRKFTVGEAPTVVIY
jgi:hypothetical protein